jgi:hypothetical protein
MEVELWQCPVTDVPLGRDVEHNTDWQRMRDARGRIDCDPFRCGSIHHGQRFGNSRFCLRHGAGPLATIRPSSSTAWSAGGNSRACSLNTPSCACRHAKRTCVASGNMLGASCAASSASPSPPGRCDAALLSHPDKRAEHLSVCGKEHVG